MIRIKLIKSPIGSTPQVRRTIKALGLNKMQRVREYQKTNPALLGMIESVKTYLKTEEIK